MLRFAFAIYSCAVCLRRLLLVAEQRGSEQQRGRRAPSYTAAARPRLNSQAEPDVQITNSVPSDIFVCADAGRLVQVGVKRRAARAPVPWRLLTRQRSHEARF